MNMNDTIPTEIMANAKGFSAWMWVALAEFVAIVLLFLRLKKHKKTHVNVGSFSKKDLEITDKANADMGNLMNSITKSRELYKELSRKYHPDRFVNTPLYETAQELFQRITESKRSYRQLSLLKEEAIVKLNIE